MFNVLKNHIITKPSLDLSSSSMHLIVKLKQKSKWKDMYAMFEFYHWRLGLTKKRKHFFVPLTIWEKELFLYLTTVCETFTDIFRNVLNMIVDPLRRVSGSQLVVVFSLLTKCPSSLFLPFFSFSFSVTLTIAMCIFFAYTPGLLVTP